MHFPDLLFAERRVEKVGDIVPAAIAAKDRRSKGLASKVRWVVFFEKIYRNSQNRRMETGADLILRLRCSVFLMDRRYRSRMFVVEVWICLRR